MQDISVKTPSIREQTLSLNPEQAVLLVEDAVLNKGFQFSKNQNSRPLLNIALQISLKSALNLSNKEMRVDGDIGKTTDKFIKEFQRKNNLGKDGVVGQQTIAFLKESILGSGEKEVTLSRLTNVKAPTTPNPENLIRTKVSDPSLSKLSHSNTNTTSRAGEPLNYNKLSAKHNEIYTQTLKPLLKALENGELQIGSGKSEAVRSLQELLPYVDAEDVDGVFGNQTSEALKKFNLNRGISNTGEVTKETLIALVKHTTPIKMAKESYWNSENLGIERSPSQPYLTAFIKNAGVIKETTHQHTITKEVLSIQNLLGLKPSGLYDASTANAIGDFQKRIGLIPDKQVGPQTLMAIYRDQGLPFDEGLREKAFGSKVKYSLTLNAEEKKFVAVLNTYKGINKAPPPPPSFISANASDKNILSLIKAYAFRETEYGKKYHIFKSRLVENGQGGRKRVYALNDGKLVPKVGDAGEFGALQFTKDTFEMYYDKLKQAGYNKPFDKMDNEQQVLIAKAFCQDLLYRNHGDSKFATSGYNGGPTHVSKAIQEALSAGLPINWTFVGPLVAEKKGARSAITNLSHVDRMFKL